MTRRWSLKTIVLFNTTTCLSADQLLLGFVSRSSRRTLRTSVMDYHWLKMSPSLNKGIQVINDLEEARFEQFLRRIVTKLKVQDAQIFTDNERMKLEKLFKVNEEVLQLAVKTVLYLFKRILKFIFMPAVLKADLKKIGLNNDKADVFVKVWSAETRKSLDEIGTEVMEDSGDSMNFSWKLNAELSSDYQKKCKIPKAYISFTNNKNDLELELTHPELYSMFLQFESIQNELDLLM